jgi:chorismate mutase / prephenate dehydratase
MDLDSLRKQIDAVDLEIIERLNARVRLAGEVGRAKQKHGAHTYVPSREEAVFERLIAANPGPLTPAALKAVYREIISASVALQKELAIAYLGPEATFTHQAALKNFGSSLRFQPCATIPDVFTAVERGEADHGVVPIENSTEGAVFHSLDMLVETELKIVAQVFLPIEHCLISKEPLEKIKIVFSRDQALGQCREWLRRNLPAAPAEAMDSTAEAVRRARETPGAAAVASRLAAELYGVPIVAAGIQDRADNVTRFLVLGKNVSPPLGQGRDKTSLVFSLHDQPGALLRALEPFSARGVNLSKIESRPSRQKVWHYYFFIDCLGHWEDAVIQEAVTALRRECPFVKWLGSYPNTNHA